MDWAETTARRDEKHLSFGIWCVLMLMWCHCNIHNIHNQYIAISHLCFLVDAILMVVDAPWKVCGTLSTTFTPKLCNCYLMCYTSIVTFHEVFINSSVFIVFEVDKWSGLNMSDECLSSLQYLFQPISWMTKSFIHEDRSHNWFQDLHK